MAIQNRDVKLLWGKAAGRCSICRIPLVSSTGDSEVPSNVIVGEMAHIVGEKHSTNSPRGISKLPEENRNDYANLILLCPNDHTIIDKDENEWPVERLHVIKREHELWVEEQLGSKLDEKTRIYDDFIDRVALTFELEHWEYLCDNLFRQIMPVDFPDGVYQLGFEHFRAIMPGKEPDFETALEALIVHSRVYVDHYLSEAKMTPGDPRIMARRRYRDDTDEDFLKHQALVDVHNKWERNCTMLLFNCVHALNLFADEVRKKLRPNFFIRQGKFCVHDFMGLMGASMVETWHLPERYFTKEDLDGPLRESGDTNTE